MSVGVRLRLRLGEREFLPFSSCRQLSSLVMDVGLTWGAGAPCARLGTVGAPVQPAGPHCVGAWPLSLSLQFSSNA